MKPTNPYLGASPLRTSRTTYLDVQDKAYDSVIFQQSKSILDFDLNVMQSILQSSIQRLTKMVFPKSGFVTTPTFTNISNNIFSMSDSRVNFFGVNCRVADPSRTNQAPYLDFSTHTDGALSSTNSIFAWLELWFQEVAPSLVTEAYDNSSTLENKPTTIYQYGLSPTYDRVVSSTSLTNEMLDSGFGAETTRRVQIRWRIRSTRAVNSGSYDKGFCNSATPSVTNPQVFAQGGRATCAFTVSTASTGTTLTLSGINTSGGGYVALGQTITGVGIPSGTTITAFGTGSATTAGTYTVSQSITVSANQIIYGWFTPSKTFLRADQTTGSDFNKDGDTNVYIAGDGSATDASLLNTVDGRVYGIPLGFCTTPTTFTSTGIVPVLGGSCLGNATATQVDLSTLLVTGTGLSATSNNDINIVPGGTGSVIIGGATAATNGKLQLPSTANNTAASPALSFTGQTTSGLYYNSGVAITQGGTNVATFNSSGSTINTNLVTRSVQAGNSCPFSSHAFAKASLNSTISWSVI